MILVSHPTGNNNVKELIKEMDSKNMLYSFETCVAINENSSIIKILPKTIREELLRRAFLVKKERIKQSRFREIVRIILSRTRMGNMIKNNKGPFGIDAINKELDKSVAKKLIHLKGKIDGVYCYEDCALETFRQAKKFGMKCYYELPIGYWEYGIKIQKEESELNPLWKETMQIIKDNPEKLKRKEEELRLADIIFVPSEFVKETLKDTDIKAKIIISPYGVKRNCLKKKRTNERTKLKIIYVGILTQRKGLSYLFDAISQLKNRVDLTLIGLPLKNTIQLTNELKKYRWIPSAPNKTVMEEMRKSDLLVLPTLFDGFGLVILEAMSQGTPVITTKNSCAPEVIKNGKDGFIVPLRNSKEIVNKIKILNKDRELLKKMSNLAKKKSEEFTWEKYTSKIIKNIK